MDSPATEVRRNEIRPLLFPGKEITVATAEVVLKNVKDKRPCKILYETVVDQDEFYDFYDFSPRREFLGVGDEDMDEVDDDNEE